MPELTPIPRPPWAKAVDVERCDRFEDADFDGIQGQRPAVDTELWRAVGQYFSSLSAGTAFPDPARLTGECYVASESYWVQDEPWFARAGRHRQVCFSILVHCLERPTALNAADRDYLGLEVHFRWLGQEGSFAWVATDSSSI